MADIVAVRHNLWRNGDNEIMGGGALITLAVQIFRVFLNCAECSSVKGSSLRGLHSYYNPHPNAAGAPPLSTGPGEGASAPRQQEASSASPAGATQQEAATTTAANLTQQPPAEVAPRQSCAAHPQAAAEATGRPLPSGWEAAGKLAGCSRETAPAVQAGGPARIISPFSAANY